MKYGGLELHVGYCAMLYVIFNIMIQYDNKTVRLS